jgi:transposase
MGEVSSHNVERRNPSDALGDRCLPHLNSFAAGLPRDRTAVLNGLTAHYSSAPVEGTVNRIKMIKRLYGRAKFDLLRKRILIAA